MSKKHFILVLDNKLLKQAVALKLAGATDAQKKKIFGENYREWTIDDVLKGNE